jgi:nucleotide-binding universal stress UspA family protein
MKLLLAVDSITTLEIILDAMMARSWSVGTQANVLSIVEDDEVPAETWREEGYTVGAVRKEMRRRGEQITALAVEGLRRIGIPAEVAVMRGNPEFLISFAAMKWPADLILIRAHNRTDFRNWMLGSVAKSVIESAPCSVEVVRAMDEPYQVCAESNYRILVATDGSDTSLAAAQAMAEENWPGGTEVNVVSVVNPLIYSLEEIGVCRDRATKRAHLAIGDAFQALKNASLKITGDVITGRVSHAIINRARTWRADLVILGTHERRGLNRLLFRSVSAAIASRGHCSVRIIRGRTVSRDRKLLPLSRAAAIRSPKKLSWLARDFAKRKAA